MTIAEIAEKFKLSADTLRYYEKIGLLDRVNRTSGGIRNYTEDDLKSIEFVCCMRNAGVSIEALLEYKQLFALGDSTIERRKEILREQSDILTKKIKSMQTTLDRLNYKIENYDVIMAHNNEDKTDK